MLDPLETKNFICFPNPCGTAREPRGWKSFDFYSMKQPQAPREPGSRPVPKARGGSGVGQARCQVAGEGLPDEGRLSRAVRRRPRGAGASTSFLPPQPHSLALGFAGGSSAFPNHQRPPSPFFPPQPAPASEAHLRPLLRPRPRPRPPLVGPLRLGPLPLAAAAAPFTIALPASLLSAPGSLPPAALSAHARSRSAAAAAAPFFF